MLYKRPIIALTSLLDLLFILIFAYQMDIKSDADKYVQAEVEKRISLDIPDQSELVAELQDENQRVRGELEIVREKVENIDEYKQQLEEYKTQRDQLRNRLASITKKAKTVLNDKLQSENYKQQVIELRNELQQKESELVAAKQESESVKRQSKTDGVIPTTKKDAEMTKMLVGTWNEYCDYFSWRNRELPTRTKIAVSNYKCVFSGDGKYSERGTFRAINGDVMLDNSIILGEGQSESIVSEGKWWVKDGYLYVRTANDTSGMEILFINQQEYKISDDRRLAVGVRSR